MAARSGVCIGRLWRVTTINGSLFLVRLRCFGLSYLCGQLGVGVADKNNFSEQELSGSIKGWNFILCV